MKRAFVRRCGTSSLGLPVNLNPSDNKEKLAQVLLDVVGLPPMSSIIVAKDDYTLVSLDDLSQWQDGERIVVLPGGNGALNDTSSFDFILDDHLITEIESEAMARGAFCNDLVARRALFHNLISLTQTRSSSFSFLFSLYIGHIPGFMCAFFGHFT